MVEIPYTVDETEDYAVVWKPPRMHCAPLRERQGDTLLEWYAAQFPPVLELAGRKKEEGGLVHRLDFETQGLALLAKNQHALDFFQSIQNKGKFIKEYQAICTKADLSLPGFPPRPPLPPFPFAETLAIESFFRPFGPGRKQVRPLIAQGGPYRTEILGVSGNSEYAFALRLNRGFRHQIRCHLAWIGFPILNDPVYGTGAGKGYLALQARAFFFFDPKNGKEREYRLAIRPISM
jgi:23S rRNA pseudouridine1911/1915/1917 synthase